MYVNAGIFLKKTKDYLEAVEILNLKKVTKDRLDPAEEKFESVG